MFSSFLKRLLYLIYYIWKSDYRQLGMFIRYASTVTGKPYSRLVFDVVHSVFKFNVSFKDYFCFRFFELNTFNRKLWAGTGYMYEYQVLMNPRESRGVLEDKAEFLKYFKRFVHRGYLTIEDIRNREELTDKLISNPSGKLVLKWSKGQIGAEVKIVNCHELTNSFLKKYMEINHYDLAEEFVVQHSDLMSLSPSGLNTIRIVTQYHSGKVDILAARLRISVNSEVDNMAAGNIAAPIDLASGMVCGPGVYSDITLEDTYYHPVTCKKLMGFVIPHWSRAVELTKEVAQLVPQNKSIGWDIAITEEGPELIEGNHNWCKLLWQMPVKKGLKAELEKYL